MPGEGQILSIGHRPEKDRGGCRGRGKISRSLDYRHSRSLSRLLKKIRSTSAHHCGCRPRMTRQLEFFGGDEQLEDVAAQMAAGPNVGMRDPGTKGWRKLSPGLMHARVAREPSPTPEAAPKPPVDSPALPEAISAAVPRVITTPDELLDLLRRRRDDL